MDNSNRTFSDLVGLLKSWIPWRSEPAQVSRDFWMPDQSCRVCYECDSQFTWFHRRHHCRLCGRIFCNKCTSNWIPAELNRSKVVLEEYDSKIRACNYCFKQWKKGLTVSTGEGLNDSNLDSTNTSPVSASTSFTSTKSSGTCDSPSVAFVSFPPSARISPRQSPLMEASVEIRGFVAATSKDHAADTGEQPSSQDQFGYYPSRSDDDEDEYGISRFGSTTSHISQVNGYCDNVQFGDINCNQSSCKVHPDGDAIHSPSLSSSSVQNSLDSQASEDVHLLLEKGIEHDIIDECEAPSSMYVAEDVDTEPVDFEKNGVLWLPPEPEDEEDEREVFLFEDDDEDCDTSGDWGLRNSNSSGSGEFRNREKSNEEQKTAIKNVVNGHFRTLIAQLLQVENLLSGEENEKESWLEIITALSWEAATLLKPDMSKGGQMDPGSYVKIKCLASGRRTESMVIRGIVCKKNVAHRRMTSKIEKSRLLILGGALEYQRIANALSSFDTLLQQEMDHLKMAVAKIDAHNPDILLVEKSVSRYAQEYLLAKNISLVLNIKRPLLERIARCTGAQIVSSVDHLSSPKVGYCDMFHVERFLEEHGTAGQAGKKLMKTLMYFEGCPKPLGCTILLRGANGDELKKVKHVLQYGVFAAYHLALETSFLADEGASLPELPLQSPITVALPDKPSTIDRSISTVPGFAVPFAEPSIGPLLLGEPIRSLSVPIPSVINAEAASMPGVEYAEPSNSSAPVCSSGVKPLVVSPPLDGPTPYLVLEEKGLVDWTAASQAKTFDVDTVSPIGDFSTSSDLIDSSVKNNQSDCGDMDVSRNISRESSLQVGEKQIIEDEASLKEEFPPSPSDHQSILVSLSSRCVWKGTVCERSHLFRIKYYGNFDKPLGRFLRDHLFDQSYICHSCEMPAEAHVQCYTHRQGTLTISVKKLPEILLPGEKDGKIWMWHRCLKCPRANGFPPATRRVVMSDAAWGLSFGKFLELSFSNHAAASRVASCGHSLHRDCLRFYGFGKMVACFRYASIDVHSVYLPPSKLNFNYATQDWIEREFNEVVGRAELLFSEVLNALRVLEEKNSGQNNGLNIESRRQLADLEDMLRKEKAEFEESFQKIINKEAKEGQPAIDILELNRLRRQLIFQSYMWDNRLIYAANLDSTNQPDVEKVTSLDQVEKPVLDTENILLTNVPVQTTATEALCNSDTKMSEENHEQDLEKGPSDDTNDHLKAVHQGTDVLVSSAHGSDMPREIVVTKASDPLKSDDVSVITSLSDGQSSICISDTLDAAWTGKNNNPSDSASADTSNVGPSGKLDLEHREEDLSTSKVTQPTSIISNKPAHMEDSTSWLSMSFLSFYRSLNKNFLGSAQKLDTLSEYDPVYISSFRESEFQGGPRMLLPVGINDTVIPVYDDEPTSIIAYALLSPDYYAQLSDESERQKDAMADSFFSTQSLDSGISHSFHSVDEMMLESYRSLGSGDESVLSLMSSRSSLDPLSYTKASHARVTFVDDGPLGKVKYSVTCYYAKRFEALRRLCCPNEVDFIRSLGRCKKWGAQGGKSNVFFAKTLDDRFIIKQVTKTELESFIKFAPGYFKYLSESIGSCSPTCLAKILGIYQVSSKHLKGGKETKMDVLVMENLLFGRNITRLYDLKGSSRSRYNPDAAGSNKVLLDQNLIEAMPTSPIFVGNKAKRLLERAVWNDTAFLASVDVMDYSLLVGVDEEKHELVLGIIDFMRQYTWDKHLETWVKASGILGGPKNASPTVISPKQYKRRFRKAMTTYFLMVPDQWSPPTIVLSKSQTDLLSEENSQNNMISAE